MRSYLHLGLRGLRLNGASCGGDWSDWEGVLVPGISDGPSLGGGVKKRNRIPSGFQGKVWSVANAVLKASQIEKETLS